MPKRGKKQRKSRRRNANLARFGNPPPSIRNLQRLTMWVGFLVDTGISGPTGGFAQLISPQLIPNFQLRFSNWLNFRMLAWTAQVTILFGSDNVQSGFPAAVAAVEWSSASGGDLSPPNSMEEISVLPQTRYLSTSGFNPRNAVTLRWRNKDVNSLLFQPTSVYSRMFVRQSYIVGRIQNGSSGALANKLFIRGKLLLEFRDMVAFSTLSHSNLLKDLTVAGDEPVLV